MLRTSCKHVRPLGGRPAHCRHSHSNGRMQPQLPRQTPMRSGASAGPCSPGGCRGSQRAFPGMVCRGRNWNTGAPRLHLAQAMREAPPGISAAAVLRCLAERAAALGAHRLARAAHQRLQRLRLPPAEQVAGPRTHPPGPGHVCVHAASKCLMCRPGHVPQPLAAAGAGPGSLRHAVHALLRRPRFATSAFHECGLHHARGKRGGLEQPRRRTCPRR